MKHKYQNPVKYCFLVALCFLTLGSTAYAATQGTPGPTSTGTVTINASITSEVNITDLDDITFDATLLSTQLAIGAGATQSDDVCVWSNLPSGGYFITASGDGAANAFALNDGARTLAYNLDWSDNISTTSLSTNTKSSQFISTATQTDCGGATTASFVVTIANSEIAAMEASSNYTGVLTLLVTPN